MPSLAPAKPTLFSLNEVDDCSVKKLSSSQATKPCSVVFAKSPKPLLLMYGLTITYAFTLSSDVLNTVLANNIT